MAVNRPSRFFQGVKSSSRPEEGAQKPRASEAVKNGLKKLTQRAGLALSALSLGTSASAGQLAPLSVQVSLDPPAPTPTRAVERGVYGFDGTGSNEANNSVIHQFTQNAVAQRKGYFRGTDLVAGNYPGIVKDGVEQICTAHQQKPFDEVYLTGWSRGAVAAMHVAAEIKTQCGITPRWVGLVDSVRTSIDASWEEGSKGRNIFDTRCVHIAKKDGSERRPFLQTSGYLSCPTTRGTGDHTGIAFDPATLDFLQRDAARLAPGLFGEPSRIEDIDSRLGVRECLKVGGSWSNGICEPVDDERG